jgi:hypothetical protein
LVEEHFRFADDGSDDARFGGHPPHRADATMFDGDLADGEVKFGDTAEGIAAVGHGGRAGVGGLAGEGDNVAFDSEGAEDDAHGEVERLEDGALFDVKLKVGGGGGEFVTGIGGPVEVDAVFAQGIDKLDAGLIREIVDVVGIESAGSGTGSK